MGEDEDWGDYYWEHEGGTMYSDYDDNTYYEDPYGNVFLVDNDGSMSYCPSCDVGGYTVIGEDLSGNEDEWDQMYSCDCCQDSGGYCDCCNPEPNDPCDPTSTEYDPCYCDNVDCGEIEEEESVTNKDVADTSKKYTGQFKRGRTNPVTLETKVFDCSAWVYFVILNLDKDLAKAISSNGTPTTTAFKNYIEAHGGFRTNGPKVGDIVMWNGHIEIVVEADGNNFVMSGSSGATGSDIPRTEGEGWLDTEHYKDGSWPWGNGYFLGFWTPY
jgi:hypothetical protein